MQACCPMCQHEFDVKSSKESDPRVREVIRHYRSKFQEEFGAPPSVNYPACGRKAKELLASHSKDDIINFIEMYVSCKDSFFREAGLPFLLLPNFIQKQAVKQKVAWDGML